MKTQSSPPDKKLSGCYKKNTQKFENYCCGMHKQEHEHHQQAFGFVFFLFLFLVFHVQFAICEKSQGVSLVAMVHRNTPHKHTQQYGMHKQIAETPFIRWSSALNYSTNERKREREKE